MRGSSDFYLTRWVGRQLDRACQTRLQFHSPYVHRNQHGPPVWLDSSIHSPQYRMEGWFGRSTWTFNWDQTCLSHSSTATVVWSARTRATCHLWAMSMPSILSTSGTFHQADRSEDSDWLRDFGANGWPRLIWGMFLKISREPPLGLMSCLGILEAIDYFSRLVL